MVMVFEPADGVSWKFLGGSGISGGREGVREGGRERGRDGGREEGGREGGSKIQLWTVNHDGPGSRPTPQLLTLNCNFFKWYK